MIIAGYQGIGKSVLAKADSRFIDLESSTFWNGNNRPVDWYVYYCNMAEHLSSQGRYVLVSSHKVVLDRLHETSKEELAICCPSLELKDEWVSVLKERYQETGLEKDFKAYANAYSMYTDNIKDLMAEESRGFKIFLLDSMNKKISDIVDEIIQPKSNQINKIKYTSKIGETKVIDIRDSPQGTLCTQCLICGDPVELNEIENTSLDYGKQIYKVCNTCKSAIKSIVDNTYVPNSFMK